MKAFLSPGAEAVELEFAEKAARLRASGAAFLAVPVRDNREAAEWALACFHSQAAFVPLPANLPAPALAARLAQLPSHVFPEDLPVANAEEPALRPRNGIWAVIFSSGTTGEPKGVALTGTALEASARAHAAHSGAGGACWLLDLPLYHVGGLSVLTRAFFLGAPVALSAPQFSAPATAAWVRSGKVQGLSLVPTTLARLLREEDLPFENLKIILLGGAPAAPELAREARDRGAPIRHTYGMTEHASQIATEKLGGLEPLPGVEIRFEDDEILVRSPMLASGYFVGGQLRPLPLRGGFFPTGDLGEAPFVIRGRKSELIITGGKKVYPIEIEAALSRLSGVTDCAVLGVPHVEWGEEVTALFTGTLDEAAARAELKRRLESHKVPKRFLRVSAIPRTPTGKIQRASLARLVAEKEAGTF